MREAGGKENILRILVDVIRNVVGEGRSFVS